MLSALPFGMKMITYSMVRTVSRIFWELTDVNFYAAKDHEKIKDFLKQKLIDFDAFYQEFKEILIILAE